MASQCGCAVAMAKPFDCVERAVYDDDEMKPILAGCEELASDASRWMSVYRCRSCGTVWVEGWASSGPMEIKHLFPKAEAGVDAARWIREKGEPLPFAKWL